MFWVNTPYTVGSVYTGILPECLFLIKYYRTLAVVIPKCI